ncbi:unnamed protein product [Acidithrix sp. C25]|nr:unnamed protein product [Acidithrix sp. C25]
MVSYGLISFAIEIGIVERIFALLVSRLESGIKSSLNGMLF